MAVRRSLTYSKLGYQNHLCVWLAVGGLKKRQTFTFIVFADHRPSFSNLFHLSDHDLAGGLEHVLFFHILGIIGSFFPLTNSYFSRWLLHHQPVIHDDPPRTQMPNHQISVTFVTHWWPTGARPEALILLMVFSVLLLNFLMMSCLALVMVSWSQKRLFFLYSMNIS